MKTPYGWNVCCWSQAPSWKNQQALELLNPDRWMNFGFDPNGITQPGYIPMIWNNHVIDRQDQILSALHRYQNQTWLFLNEGHLPEQANMIPNDAVDLVFWFLNLARKNGVKINWCASNSAVNMDATHSGGLSGKEYQHAFLKEMRESGLPRPNFHGIHMYHSTTPQMFRNVWEKIDNEWRWQFLGDGQIIITEVCAENEDLDVQKAVMNEAFETLVTGISAGPNGRRGAKGVFWFSAAHHVMPFGNWPNCSLTEENPARPGTMRLTPLGEHWKILQSRLAQVNR